LGVHVWYINYGDNADTLKVTPESIQDLQQRIVAEDPNAKIEEIRLLPLTVGVKVNHTTWTTAKLADGTVLIYDKERLIGPVALVIIAILAITAIWVTYWVEVPAYMQAKLAYVQETTQYPCPGDPSRPNQPCGLHTDAQGNPLMFQSKELLRDHMASAHPEAFAYLVDNDLVDRDLGSQKAWYEQVLEWIPVIVILIGAAIFIPLITKFIPSKEAG
jgi:hypothetical protein